MGDVVDRLPELMDFGSKREQGYFYHMKSRYKFLLSTVERYASGKRVLEIGSEPYQIPVCLQEMGYEVIGIDIDPSRGEKHIEDHGLDIRAADLNQDELPLENDSVDVVIFSEVFEHLFQPLHALREIHRVLKRDGIMLLTTPNLYRLGNIVRFIKGGGFDNAYNQWEKQETIGHMGHVRQYSKPQLRTFIEKVGFEIVDADYVNFTKSSHRFAPIVNLAYRLLGFTRPFQYAVATPR